MITGDYKTGCLYMENKYLRMNQQNKRMVFKQNFFFVQMETMYNKNRLYTTELLIYQMYFNILLLLIFPHSQFKHTVKTVVLKA